MLLAELVIEVESAIASLELKLKLLLALAVPSAMLTRMAPSASPLLALLECVDMLLACYAEQEYPRQIVVRVTNCFYRIS